MCGMMQQDVLQFNQDPPRPASIVIICYDDAV